MAAELDSLDGRKDPQRCTLLVSQFRSCQVSGGTEGKEGAGPGSRLREGNRTGVGRGGHPGDKSRLEGAGSRDTIGEERGRTRSRHGEGDYGPRGRRRAGRVATSCCRVQLVLDTMLGIPLGSPNTREATPAREHVDEASFVK